MSRSTPVTHPASDKSNRQAHGNGHQNQRSFSRETHASHNGRAGALCHLTLFAGTLAGAGIPSRQDRPALSPSPCPGVSEGFPRTGFYWDEMERYHASFSSPPPKARPYPAGLRSPPCPDRNSRSRRLSPGVHSTNRSAPTAAPRGFRSAILPSRSHLRLLPILQLLQCRRPQGFILDRTRPGFCSGGVEPFTLMAKVNVP